MVYKNISDQELTIPNVGTVKPGETITSKTKLESQHLEEVVENATTTAPAEASKGEAK